MKRNAGFFVIIAAMLVASFAVLTKCMYAITKDYGESKPYNAESRISNGDVFGEDDAPSAQRKMQKKFRAMYEISRNGKSLTVISGDYLNEFWQSNYEKEVIHSLSTDEIFFIIQDSIRIYEKYDTVVLPSFMPKSSDTAVSKRFPCIAEDRVIDTLLSKADPNGNDASADIFEIIMYRLTALSSPDAFFNGMEPLRYVFGEDSVYNDIPTQYYNLLTYGDYYIPGYSLPKDREDIFNAIAGLSDNKIPDDFPDLFRLFPSQIDLIKISASADSDYCITAINGFPTKTETERG